MNRLKVSDLFHTLRKSLVIFHPRTSLRSMSRQLDSLPSGPPEAGRPTMKTPTNPARPARVTTSELAAEPPNPLAANATTPDAQVPITRDTFIVDNHVEIAISNLTTMLTYVSEGGCKDVPIPQGIKESGVLPDEYHVSMSSFFLTHS